MTTSQLSRLADLRDRFRGSTLVVPTPARIHGADWVVKSVVLGVNAVVAYPKDSPGEPQMVDFGDVFLPGDTLWRQRGGRGSSEAGWTSQNEASALANQRRQAPRVGPVDHLDLGICGCDGMQSEESCQRRAPLGLVAHPAGGEKTLRCQRFQAELEQRRVAEEAAPRSAAAQPPVRPRATTAPTRGLPCHLCGISTNRTNGVDEPECHRHSDKFKAVSRANAARTQAVRRARHAAKPAEQDKASGDAAPAASSAPAETPEKGLPQPAALTAPAQPAVVVRSCRWCGRVDVPESEWCDCPEGLKAMADWEEQARLRDPNRSIWSRGDQPEAPIQPESPVRGSLLDQIDQLIRERRQLRTENAELRARLELADDLERQLAGIRDRVERELANV